MANSDAVYIDVRTEGEFAKGHPQRAVNIPVAFPDPSRAIMVNSDFVKVVEAKFPVKRDHPRLSGGTALHIGGQYAATSRLSRRFQLTG